MDAPPNQLITRRIKLEIVSGRRRQMWLDERVELSDDAQTNARHSAKAEYHLLTNEELGEMLRKWRMTRNLSFRELAKELGISHISLWQYEKGRKRMPEWILSASEESEAGIQVLEG